MTNITQEALIKELEKLEAGSIIAIEGPCSSGKTTLSQVISKRLRLQYIDTDCFIINTKDEYISWLDIEHIKEVINSFSDRKKSLIVSGICLQRTLSLIGLSATFTVYIKKLSNEGIWNYGFDISNCMENGDNSIPTLQPHKSDMVYHLEYAPHEKANFIYTYQTD
ncbi:shikimate kinase [Aeromonas veronii]|uniref:shikimate kinase n=1 Tax=Aeromonas veronii TaxID=654 RepID=UPI001115D5B7|nr:shikimate kinase [Aeromonas veronii]MBJ7583773.1 (d)CMP kinase [Aeromonas veronii]